MYVRRPSQILNDIIVRWSSRVRFPPVRFASRVLVATSESSVLNLAEFCCGSFCAVASLFNNSIRYEANNTTTYKHCNPSTKTPFRHNNKHLQYEGEHSTAKFRFQFGRTTQDTLLDAAVRSEQVRYRHILFRLDFAAPALSDFKVSHALGLDVLAHYLGTWKFLFSLADVFACDRIIIACCSSAHCLVLLYQQHRHLWRQRA